MIDNNTMLYNIIPIVLMITIYSGINIFLYKLYI